MFNPAAFENSRPGGIGVLEIVGGKGTQEVQPLPFVALKRTELSGEVSGPLAALRLTQVYGYSREQCDHVLEAVYRFPLPGDAAVTGVRVRFGEVEIKAELQERQEAEARYKEAKQQGRQAALVTRESPDVFTLQVAGLQPDQDVRVETSYVQLARAEGSGWSLRIPLTTAPRYVRSDESTSRYAHGQPLLLLRDPGHRFSLDLTLRGTGAVESPTHPLKVTQEGGRRRVRLQEGEVIPDRDCVLSWRPPQESDRPTLQVLVHDDPASGQVYFLALVAPPAVYDPGQGVPREVILLVDHSGSMEGVKWEAADGAVKGFLSGLTECDTFSLGLFHNTTRWFSETPCPAQAGVVEEAVRFLEAHRDSGGTELGVALEQALGLERARGKYARHVLIFTDAQVSDEGRILRLASQESKQVDRRRISVLCIDVAPNSFLAVELAERGGGEARFLTSDPDEEDLQVAWDEVLADWTQPVLTGLRLEVDRPNAQAAGREVLDSEKAGWSVLDLGDLFAGRTHWVAGRVPRGETADLAFRVTMAGTREVATCQRALAEESSHHPALKALFGARRVLGLEFLLHAGYALDDLQDYLRRLGYDPEEVLAGGAEGRPKVYAENVRRDVDKALRGLLVREALDYGLACSETAFVAVRLEAGQPVEGTVAVANALPAGWSEAFLGGGGGRGTLAYAVRRGEQLISQGQYEEAITLLEEAFKAFPASPDLKRTLSDTYTERGREKFSRNDLAGAQRDLEKVLDLNENNLRAQDLLATVYNNRSVEAFNRGDLDTACDLIEKSLRMDPNNRTARQNAAQDFYARANRRFADLPQYARHGSRLDPIRADLERALEYADDQELQHAIARDLDIVRMLYNQAQASSGEAAGHSWWRRWFGRIDGGQR